ncbi:MAG: hypothetical protein ACK5MW_04265 [Enterococcus sp.]
MKTHLKTGLGIMIQTDGEEKLASQTFSNIVDGIEEAQALALGDIVQTLLPQESSVVSVVETKQVEYVK